jgi:hypothetical protein
MPSDHATAPQTSLPAGVLGKSARAASTIVVNGFASATGSSQPGIDSTGTSADETNVIGNRMLKPYPRFARTRVSETACSNVLSQAALSPQ